MLFRVWSLNCLFLTYDKVRIKHKSKYLEAWISFWHCHHHTQVHDKWTPLSTGYRLIQVPWYICIFCFVFFNFCPNFLEQNWGKGTQVSHVNLSLHVDSLPATGGVFVTAEERTHHNPSPWFMWFTLGAVPSVDLDKCIMTCLHRYVKRYCGIILVSDLSPLHSFAFATVIWLKPNSV